MAGRIPKRRSRLLPQPKPETKPKPYRLVEATEYRAVVEIELPPEGRESERNRA